MMFKRFHDTEKWDKPWFRKLSPAEKCAWDFMLSRCDNVGVWIPDYESAEFYIGQSINWDLFIEKCSANITILDNGKIWFHDFCKFQYGKLSEACKPHKSYIKMLKSHGIYHLVEASETVNTVSAIRSRVTEKIRIHIYNRDRGTCQYCGEKLESDNFVIDHFIPISKGGNSATKNLILSCSKCNALKSDFLPDDFIARNPTFSDAVLRVRDFLDTLLTDSDTLQEKEKEKEKEKEQDIEKKTKNLYTTDFENLWDLYPKKAAKDRAAHAYHARIKEGVSHVYLVSCLKNYVAQCERKKTELDFYLNLATFLNSRYAEYEPPKAYEPVVERDEIQQAIYDKLQEKKNAP